MNNYLLITILINCIINLFFLVLFEKSKPAPKNFLPIVIMCSAASLGRLVFSIIPQVQPVTALVIITGSSMGPIYGFITGSASALFSNMLLGQGIWTLFQMTAWGLIGFIAGIIGKFFSSRNKQKKTNKSLLELVVFIVYGFISAILYSLITDTLTISYFGNTLNVSSAMVIFISGIAFNISHGIFNSILICMLYQPFTSKLKRISSKIK